MSTNLIDYGVEVEEAISKLENAIEMSSDISEKFPSRWLAIALLDQDSGVEEELIELKGGAEIIDSRDELLTGLTGVLGDSIDTAIAGSRYDVVHDVAQSSSKRSGRASMKKTDRFYAIVMNKYLGIPIFLAAMWVLFMLTTDVAGAFLDWVDGTMGGPISFIVSEAVRAVGLGGTWVESVLVDGIVAGLGAILVFLPVLFFLFLALAFLEDTGYMARAAFVMDRLMRGVGLQGKSFLPMLVGFGCTVPAVYATRTLESERDRILTSLLTPFMSCSARLPVYILMSAVFFPRDAGLIVFSMYLLGIIVALVFGLILRGTSFKVTGYTPTIMEIPSYRMPTIRSIWFHTWVRMKAFLEEAGTIIFVTMLGVWLLMAIPVAGVGSFADVEVNDSAFVAVAEVTAPIFEPAGFGSWEASGALMSGFVAKEVVIGTMAQVYGVEEDGGGDEEQTIVGSLQEIVVGLGRATLDAAKAIPAMVGIEFGAEEEPEELSDLMTAIKTGFESSSGGHGGLAAIAFMVFVLLYTPCMAAVGAIKHEIGVKWMWVSVIGQSVIAWLFAVIVFQGGILFGLG